MNLTAGFSTRLRSGRNDDVVVGVETWEVVVALKAGPSTTLRSG